MIKRERFANPLDGRELIRVSSDQGLVIEKGGVEYDEAVVEGEADSEGFSETDKKVRKGEVYVE